MLSAGRRAAGGADAALRRHVAGGHHPDLDPLLPGALRPRCGRHDNRQAVVADDSGRRHRRQHRRALCAGAAVQDRLCGGRLLRRGPAVVCGRGLQVRQRPAEGAADEALWLRDRHPLHPDGDRRRAVLEPADDLLQPPDPSIGRDLLGIGRADLDSRRARLCLYRLAGRRALSRRDGAASAVRARLHLADRRRAGDADVALHRPARRARRACAVQAAAGDRIRLLSFHRRRAVRDKSHDRAVAASYRTNVMSDPQAREIPTAFPPEIDRWNWGAFLLNWIWGVGNNTFIALLTLVPFVGLVMPFVLGAKGSRWAWRNGRWDSVAHFQRVQRLWAIWGVVIWLGAVALFGGIFGGTFYLLKNSDAYQLGVARLQANTEAMNALGAPISTGIPFGKIAINGASGRAALSFSVTGSKAAGRLFLEAIKKDGVWSLTALKLKMDGREDLIDLLSVSRVEIETPIGVFGTTAAAVRDEGARASRIFLA